MLLFADVFMRLLVQQRILWIDGVLGSGKTCLSTWLTSALISTDTCTHFVSNIAISGRTRPVPVPLQDAVIVMDEAQLYFKRWVVVEQYVSYMRRMNLYLLMPAWQPPHKRLQGLKCERWLNLYPAGLPLWIYKWRASREGAKAQTGYFYLWQAHRAFGLYDTNAVPEGDGGIMTAIRQTVGIYAQLSKQNEGQYSTRTTAKPSDGYAARRSGRIV